MRVHFQRSGGFAGLTLNSEFDSTTMSTEQASELARLIAESRFFELPKAMPSMKPMADCFQYLISVEDGREKHSVELEQQSVPEHLQPLLKWLIDAQRNLIAAQKQNPTA